jgi:hypothetical protein
VEAKIESATCFICNESACPEHGEEVETEAVCGIEGAIEASTRYVCCNCHRQSEAEDKNQNQTESSDDIARSAEQIPYPP